MRRRLIAAAAAAFAVAIALPVAAQDARTTAVQAAARTWLALADRGDAVATYAAAGPKFASAISADRWGSALPASVSMLGAVVQRTAVSTQFMRTLQGQPEGDYAQLVFRTAFANKAVSRELVTLELIDGQWRVITYIIK